MRNFASSQNSRGTLEFYEIKGGHLREQMRIIVAVGLLLLELITVPGLSALQDHGEKSARRVEPPLDQKVKRFELVDESLIDGIGKLSQLPIGLHFGVEEILGETFSDPIARSVRFSVNLQDSTIREILDTLCRSDARYLWSTDGATVNIYPRSTVGDTSHLLNRQIERISLNGIPDPEQALTPLARQFYPSGEQIGYAALGGDLTYAEPWTVVFENLTVRQFINRLAEHMGPRSSWFWKGTNHERFFTFIKGT